MSVALASDHAGFHLKETIRAYLQEKGMAYHDYGVDRLDRVDYPDQALLVAEAVSQGEFRCGVLVCGTGLGMVIAANKVPGIRAVVCHDTFSARMARAHNDANILAMGERVIGPGLALDVVAAFLDGPFLGERHAARVAKILAIEEKYRHTGR